MILHFLNILGSARYGHLCDYINERTLDRGLEELLNLDLIEIHQENRSKKKWYEITKKGKELLRMREEIAALVDAYE